MIIRRATLADLELLAPLFDDYRRFYGKAPDLALARRYLGERLGRGESVVFLAHEDGRGLGLTQLYPSWDSLSAAPLFVLYDLYVAPEARRRGVARELLDAARRHAAAAGASKVVLSTAVDNQSAQRLYQSVGYIRDDAFYYYELPLQPMGKP